MIETHLLPAFGDMRVEDITAPMIERWIGGLQNQRNVKWRLSNRSRNKILVVSRRLPAGGPSLGTAP